MVPVNASRYFNERRHLAGEGYPQPVFKARRIKTGDSIVLQESLAFEVTAGEDGWLISYAEQTRFFNDQDFAIFEKNMEKVDPKTLTVKRQDLPANADPKPVKKGENMFTQPWPHTRGGIISRADRAGWLVTLNGKRKFIDDIDFRIAFNTAAAPLDDGQALYRMKTEDPTPMKYVEIDRETVFAFRRGPIKALAGSVLIENPKDEDGYTLAGAEHFIVTKPAGGAASPSAENGRKPKMADIPPLFTPEQLRKKR